MGFMMFSIKQYDLFSLDNREDNSDYILASLESIWEAMIYLNSHPCGSPNPNSKQKQASLGGGGIYSDPLMVLHAKP